MVELGNDPMELHDHIAQLTAVAATMRGALQSVLDCAPCPTCVTTAEDALEAYDALTQPPSDSAVGEA